MFFAKNIIDCSNRYFHARCYFIDRFALVNDKILNEYNDLLVSHQPILRKWRKNRKYLLRKNTQSRQNSFYWRILCHLIQLDHFFPKLEN